MEASSCCADQESFLDNQSLEDEVAPMLCSSNTEHSPEIVFSSKQDEPDTLVEPPPNNANSKNFHEASAAEDRSGHIQERDSAHNICSEQSEKLRPETVSKRGQLNEGRRSIVELEREDHQGDVALEKTKLQCTPNMKPGAKDRFLPEAVAETPQALSKREDTPSKKKARRSHSSQPSSRPSSSSEPPVARRAGSVDALLQAGRSGSREASRGPRRVGSGAPVAPPPLQAGRSVVRDASRGPRRVGSGAPMAPIPKTGLPGGTGENHVADITIKTRQRADKVSLDQGNASKDREDSLLKMLDKRQRARGVL